MSWRRYTVNECFLDTIGGEQAWLLGLLAADGNVERTRRTFTLAQSGEDGARVVGVVREMLNYTGPLRSSGRVTTLKVTSGTLVARLADFGVVPAKSLVYRFPEVLPAEQAQAFMRGYVEGDGSVGLYRMTHTVTPIVSYVGTPEFVSASRTFFPVAGHYRPILRARNLAELRFNGKDALTVADWLWADATLPSSRKQAIIARFLVEHQPLYVRYAERRQRAAEMLAEGVPVPEIASALGLPFQTIYKWRASQKGDTWKST